MQGSPHGRPTPLMPLTPTLLLGLTCSSLGMAALQAEGKVIAEAASQPTVRAVPGGHLGATDTEGSSGPNPG